RSRLGHCLHGRQSRQTPSGSSAGTTSWPPSAAISHPRSLPRKLRRTSAKLATKSGGTALRVGVDTNILVSALLNERGAPARILTAFREGRFTLVTSMPLLEELEEVLT